MVLLHKYIILIMLLVMLLLVEKPVQRYENYSPPAERVEIIPDTDRQVEKKAKLAADTSMIDQKTETSKNNQGLSIIEIIINNQI
ncbi:MAG: hypothetical protein ACLFUC_08835 [Bacteroidales bacterium]